jgi:hypothetical protein
MITYLDYLLELRLIPAAYLERGGHHRPAMAQRWYCRFWRLIDLTRSLRARADENSVMVQGLINKAFAAPAERKA